jgi:acyl carrier protein
MPTCGTMTCSTTCSAPGAVPRSVEAHVRLVVADCLGVTVDDLGPTVSLADDLAVDSLDLLEVVFALEAELGMPLPNDALDGIRTYGDLLGVVREVLDRGRVLELPGAIRPAPGGFAPAGTRAA